MLKLKKCVIVTLSLVSFWLQFCNSGKKDPSIETIDFGSISIDKKEFKDFMNMDKIKKVVKLKTSDNSLLGNVNFATFEENGNLYVGDYYSSKRVYRFNHNGTFITSYGSRGQGPGEYNRIIHFAPTSTGDLILLTLRKIIKFNNDGKLIKEIRIHYLGRDIVVLDDLIYVVVLRYQYAPERKKAIFIYNTELEKVGEICDYDTRLEKYLYIQTKVCTKSSNKLFFIDIYDLRLRAFDPGLRKISQLLIPNENKTLNATWGKKHFNEKDREKIKKNLHRFNLIYGFQDGLFLLEFCKYKNIFDYWILNLDAKKAVIFTYPDKKFFENNLYFTVVGSYSNGLIGVFNDAEKFNKHKEDFPVLKDIKFSIEDNPVLVFLEFNKI